MDKSELAEAVSEPISFFVTATLQLDCVPILSEKGGSGFCFDFSFSLATVVSAD